MCAVWPSFILLLVELWLNEAGEYALTAARKFSKYNPHRNDVPFFVECRQIRSRPIQLSVSRFDIPPQTIFMCCSKFFRNDGRQLLADQFSGMVAEDSESSGVRENHSAGFVDAEH